MSVQFSDSVVSNSLWPHGLQHPRPPCPSPTPRVYSNSWPLSWWCHPTIKGSGVANLKRFPVSKSQLFSEYLLPCVLSIKFFSIRMPLSSLTYECTLSCVPLFANLWTVARQAPPSMGLPRQEYWSGAPSPSPKYRLAYKQLGLKGDAEAGTHKLASDQLIDGI